MVTTETIDWAKVERTAWWKAMVACPQDPRYHGEGDVATHTRLVVEALESEPTFAELAPESRRILRWAALLHDVGKPATTRTDDNGRISSNGHARVGAQLARRFLWELGEPFATREAICGLVRWHMRPGYICDATEPERTVLTIAETTRCDWLYRLAVADTRGRIAPDTDEALARVALFGELSLTLGCSVQPFAFASDHSRFQYFRTPGRDPHYAAFDDTRGKLIVLSGLPGSGKDTYIQQHLTALPSISLDAIRAEKGIAPTDPQEQVVMVALERLREHLRRGEDVVWNATNLRFELRARPINLAADYRYRVEIVYRETTRARLFAQNRNRAAVVPEVVLERMIDRWEVPTRLEAHRMEAVDALLP